MGDERMAVAETERHGQILVARLNRPERLNALNHELWTELEKTWAECSSFGDCIEVRFPLTWSLSEKCWIILLRA